MVTRAQDLQRRALTALGMAGGAYIALLAASQVPVQSTPTYDAPQIAPTSLTAATKLAKTSARFGLQCQITDEVTQQTDDFISDAQGQYSYTISSPGKPVQGGPMYVRNPTEYALNSCRGVIQYGANRQRVSIVFTEFGKDVEFTVQPQTINTETDRAAVIARLDEFAGRMPPPPAT